MGRTRKKTNAERAAIYERERAKREAAWRASNPNVLPDKEEQEAQ